VAYLNKDTYYLQLKNEFSKFCHGSIWVTAKNTQTNHLNTGKKENTDTRKQPEFTKLIIEV